MGKFRPEFLARLSLLATLLGALYGCPMASPGAGAPAAVSGGPSASDSPASPGDAATDAGGNKESPADITRSQPVAMPSGVFSQGPTPECTLTLSLQAKPVCFYGDGGKRVEMSGHINLVCSEKEREQSYESPTVRIVNKDAEFVEFPVLREDRTFAGAVRTHQSELALDSCFANREAIVNFAGPGLFDAMPCSGDECRSKCDGVFDKIEMISVDERRLPRINPQTGQIEMSTVNLLPPCGNEPELKQVPEGTPSSLIREADPVVCKTTSGGLFRCTQGRETFCATLFGERRECP